MEDVNTPQPNEYSFSKAVHESMGTQGDRMSIDTHANGGGGADGGGGSRC